MTSFADRRLKALERFEDRVGEYDDLLDDHVSGVDDPTVDSKQADKNLRSHSRLVRDYVIANQAERDAEHWRVKTQLAFLAQAVASVPDEWENFCKMCLTKHESLPPASETLEKEVRNMMHAIGHTQTMTES